MLCNHHSLVPEHFTTPKVNPVPIKQSLLILLSPPRSPWQPLIYFLSLQICLFRTFHINGVTYFAIFCAWLLSLSVTYTSFIHVAAGVSTSFLAMAKSYSIVWIYCILFIHLSVNGHLGCFHLLAIVDHVAMNMCVQVSV